MQLRISICCTALAVGLGLPAIVHAGPVEDLAASRRKLRSFRATYIERIDVNRTPAPSSPGAVLGWGSKSSEIPVEASVDSNSSELKYPNLGSEGDVQTGGKRIFFNKGERSFQFIEGGMRGAFDRHQSGMLNPAAAAYEIHGQSASMFFDKYPNRSETGRWVKVSDAHSETEIRFHALGNQMMIEEVLNRNLKGKETRVRIEQWHVESELAYPKVVVLTFMNQGEVTQTRTYTLQKVLAVDFHPLQPPLMEGALIKDEEKGIVYKVRNGQLEVDPVFSRNRSDSSGLAALLTVVACFSLGLWTFLRLRQLAHPASA